MPVSSTTVTACAPKAERVGHYDLPVASRVVASHGGRRQAARARGMQRAFRTDRQGNGGPGTSWEQHACGERLTVAKDANEHRERGYDRSKSGAEAANLRGVWPSRTKSNAAARSKRTTKRARMWSKGMLRRPPRRPDEERQRQRTRASPFVARQEEGERHVAIGKVESVLLLAPPGAQPGR